MTYEEHIDEIFNSETFEESIKRRIKDSIAKYLAAERSRTIEECKAVCHKKAEAIRKANTYKGKVNLIAEESAGFIDTLADELDILKAKGGKP